MDLEFVIARLKAQAKGLRAIGGAADLDTALASVVVLPSAYVIPLADASQWQRHTGAHDETDQIDFGVVMAVANLKDARGEAAMGVLVPVRQTVRAALSGWVPDTETGEPIHKGAGRLLRIDGDGRLWWIDTYHYTTFYRSEQ